MSSTDIQAAGPAAGNAQGSDPRIASALASLFSYGGTSHTPTVANFTSAATGSNTNELLANILRTSPDILSKILPSRTDITSVLPRTPATAGSDSWLAALAGAPAYPRVGGIAGLSPADHQLALLASTLGGSPVTGLTEIYRLLESRQPSHALPQAWSHSDMLRSIAQRNFGGSDPIFLNSIAGNPNIAAAPIADLNTLLLKHLANNVNNTNTPASAANLVQLLPVAADPPVNPPAVPPRKRKASQNGKSPKSKSPRFKKPLEPDATNQNDGNRKAAAVKNRDDHNDDTLPPSPPNASNLPLLYNPMDEGRLSKFQILARKQVEFFEATAEDLEASCQGRNRPILLGQVGMRCRRCSHLPNRQRMRASTYYPSTVAGIYQYVVFQFSLRALIF